MTPKSRMFERFTAFAFLILASPLVLATNVIITTPFGDIEVELFDEETPETVENFLTYVRDGRYEENFIHRSIPGFIIQGGSFIYDPDGVQAVETDDPVINEFGVSNTRGTIAMAKLGGDPDSATSGWFINLGDNSENLDNQNGGFTVFGRVVGNGMDVVDEIADQDTWNAGGAFADLPLIDYPGSGDLTRDYFVITDINEVVPFNINAGLNDAWYNPATNGQGFFIIVFPIIKKVFVAWFTFDSERPDDSVMAQLGGPGQRWLTAFGDFEGNTATLDIELTQGGQFNDSATPVEQTNDGTLVIEFADCGAALVTYEITSANLQGEIPIQRVVNDNIALCESL